MKQVFISYARDDGNVARELRESFRDTEFSGWMDQADIATGEAIAQKVKDSLRQASAMVVLLSERSLKNQWVQFELGAAIAMNKPIIAILIGQAGIKEALPDFMQGLLYIDARGRPIQDVTLEVARALRGKIV
jgi:hypothetical protein